MIPRARLVHNATVQQSLSTVSSNFNPDATGEREIHSETQSNSIPLSMSTVHRTIGVENTCGFQSRVNEALDALRTFHSLRTAWNEKIELREDLKSRRGLAVSLEIICHNCGESTSTMSSKISNKCYDINLRLTYGMSAIGKGLASARIFCGLMNLPPPPAKFECHNSVFLNVLKTISEDSMNAAVHEAVIENDNN
ncbi:uncharacterized protein TNCV_2180841 [Trichonephila clavipes]|uniref:Mutator-like transposase domain-containing protein n=1 Tax=Trichonephila clavipes TaxID=2585209 RepID=A0A8X6VUM9_TRICX|nr:uncharacterized protein TNCV_2180841 [Trichonephila clavipes]